MKADRIAVLGVPCDANSSFLRGCALAPGRIRETMASGAMNLTAEDGTDLDALHARWRDAGDAAVPDGAGAFDAIERAAAAILDGGERLLALGGDHSITFPLVRAHSARHDDLTILHVDAHPDLYDEYGGSRESHACPFARIMESGLAKRLVQVGIRAMNAPQRKQADRFDVEVIPARLFQPGVDLRLTGPVYVSLDLDGLDPAFAPGVSHPEPGGLSVRDVLGVVQGLNARVVGADIVEFNPVRDVNGITAVVAVKLLKELLAKMMAT